MLTQWRTSHIFWQFRLFSR